MASQTAEAYAGDSTVTFYEIPMMGGRTRLAKPFVDRGMRNGTPRSATFPRRQVPTRSRRNP